MKEEISKNIIKQLCNDFVDTICVGLEEYPDEFSCTLVCINFVYELKVKGIYLNFKIISDCSNILESMYNESTKYLVRQTWVAENSDMVEYQVKIKMKQDN